MRLWSSQALLVVSQQWGQWDCQQLHIGNNMWSFIYCSATKIFLFEIHLFKKNLKRQIKNGNPGGEAEYTVWLADMVAVPALSQTASTGTFKYVAAILTNYFQHSTSRGRFVVGDGTLILSHQSPGYCQCVGVGGCHCICQYLRRDVVGTVLSHCTVVACPRDISSRTTSGGAGESECWSSGIQLWCQLKLYGGYHKVSCGRLQWERELDLHS